MQSHVMCLVLLAAIVVIGFAVPLNFDELENMATCKELCGNCGCLGFYCGEECLCECDGEGEEGTECISKMQDDCKRKKLPFEVLIQGSSGNRLVRSLYAVPSHASEFVEGVCLAKDSLSRKQRSTFSIYKPIKDDEDTTPIDLDESIRNVQEYLTEIEAELDNELQRETQDNNEESGIYKRDVDETDIVTATESGTVSEVAVADTAAVTESEIAATGEDTADDGDSDLGMAQIEDKIISKFIATTTTTSTTAAPTRKQILQAKLEDFKAKLAEADSAKVSAMRSKQSELKAKLLADIAAKKVAMAAKAAEVKSKLESAMVASKAKLAAPVAATTATTSPPANAAVAAAVPEIKNFDLKKIDWFKTKEDNFELKKKSWFKNKDLGVASPLLDSEIAGKELAAKNKALLWKLKMKSKYNQFEKEKNAKLSLIGLNKESLLGAALEDGVVGSSAEEGSRSTEPSIIVQPSDTVDRRR